MRIDAASLTQLLLDFPNIADADFKTENAITIGELEALVAREVALIRYASLISTSHKIDFHTIILVRLRIASIISMIKSFK